MFDLGDNAEKEGKKSGYMFHQSISHTGSLTFRITPCMLKWSNVYSTKNKWMPISSEI